MCAFLILSSIILMEAGIQQETGGHLVVVQLSQAQEGSPLFPNIFHASVMLPKLSKTVFIFNHFSPKILWQRSPKHRSW